MTRFKDAVIFRGYVLAVTDSHELIRLWVGDDGQPLMEIVTPDLSGYKEYVIDTNILTGTQP